MNTEICYFNIQIVRIRTDILHVSLYFLVDTILANLINIRPGYGLRVCSCLRPRHFRARVSPGAGDTRHSDTGAGGDLIINAFHTALPWYSHNTPQHADNIKLYSLYPASCIEILKVVTKHGRILTPARYDIEERERGINEQYHIFSFALFPSLSGKGGQWGSSGHYGPRFRKPGHGVSSESGGENRAGAGAGLSPAVTQSVHYV